MKAKNRWQIRSAEQGKIERLAKEWQVSPLIAHLLVNRGMDTVEAGNHFLHDTVQEMGDPFLLKGMKEAVERICKAIENKERIVIYGDYDVDGISSTSLLWRFFKRLGIQVQYYIPERQSEGYGLNREALEHLIDEKVDLVITVDCGISSYEDVEAVQGRLDVIVTDHHEVPEQIPPAVAVINPKQPGCAYPYKQLAGVGVAYKLCQGLWRTLRGGLYTEDMEIAALGTVADVVPLLEENRIIVKYGLQGMQQTGNKGLAALMEVSGLTDKKINTGHIGFTLAPRLNAAGRVSHASEGVKLLTTDDWDEALYIAETLNETNGERQQIERSIIEAVEEELRQRDIGKEKVLVVAGQQWHSGVIGIVASRMVDKYYRPTLIISVHDGVGKGSCRSIEAFDMHGALAYASDLLIQFGGHRQAAGFSIKEENIPLLQERLNEYAAKNVKPEEYIPILHIEGTIPLSAVSLDFIDELEVMEPCGRDNPEPLFSVKEIEVEDIYKIGRDHTHIKLQVMTEDAQVDAIGWHMGGYAEHIFPGDKINLAFKMKVNEFRDTVKAQLVLEDIQLAHQQSIKIDRDMLVQIYQQLRHIMNGNGELPLYRVEQELLFRMEAKISRPCLITGLHVFKEIGLFLVSQRDGQEFCRLLAVSGKLDLTTSVTFLQHSQ